MQHRMKQYKSRWAWVSIIASAALALLAGAGASPALGQETTVTLPQYGFPLGTATVNGTPGQAQLGFVTNSTSASYVPTVSLHYGISFSAGPVSCTQTIVPVNNPGVPVPYVQTCTVTITFTPQYPGGHRDALFISGVTLGGSGVFIYGIGEAPQLMIQPGVPTSLSLPGSPYLYGSTTDDIGTYYVLANSDLYTVKDGVETLLQTSVPTTYNLSIDGAGQLWQSGYPDVNDLCYGLPYDENGTNVIAAASVCFQNPVAVTVGNLGTYYDADGGGESITYDGQTTTYIHGILQQDYQPDRIPMTPSIIVNMAYGEAPINYPIGTNFGPNGMVVDAYDNVFFSDPNNGIAVWYGCCLNNNMHLINQSIGTNPSIAVDAADTLYASQGTVQMFSASNNYDSAIAGIGYGGSVSVGPDGTVYVGDGSTIEIIDRSQGSINWGSNNGQVSAQQTLTLYNGGNQPLTISSISSTGVGYTVAPATTNGCTNGVTIAAGTVCQFLVTSTTPHKGTLTGAVTITSDSLNTPGTVQTVALTGYTSGIYVTATPSPLVFPSQTIPATMPVTLTNTSAPSSSVGYGSTVSITSALTSSNPGFSVSFPATPNSCANQVASGSTCEFLVSFNPSQATGFTGTISWTEQITNSGPSLPMSVTVKATQGPPTPPFGHLDSVADSADGSNTVAKSDSVVVRGWVADQVDGAPLSNVNVYIDGILVGPPTLGIARPDVAAAEGAAYLNSGYTLSYPASGLGLGSHAVTVIAIDSGGRSRTFGPVTFLVASAAGAAPPFGNLESALDSLNASSTVGKSDSVVIKGWVADLVDGAPLSNVSVYVDGAQIGAPTLGIARADVAAAEGAAYLDSGYQLSYPAATLSVGVHSVYVIAIDSGGRSKQFGPLAFTVAATAGAAAPLPPFGHLDSALDSVTKSTTVSPSDSVAIRGWAADVVDGAPLSNVTVYIDGNSVGVPTLDIARADVAAAEGAVYLDSGYELSYSAAGLAAGAHSVTVIAVDSGGRSKTFGPLAFTVQ